MTEAAARNPERAKKNNMSRKINILGAGAAGLTAAICLAQAGRSVDVFDNRSDCGERFGGDFQGLENFSSSLDALDELRMIGLDVNFDCTPKDKVTLTDGHKLKEVHLPTPFVYMVRRGPMAGSLDQGLKQQALEAGVRLNFGKTLPNNEVDLVATGPRTKKAFAAAMGVIFETSMDDTMIVMFNERAAFQGYSYIGVRQGSGCLCSVVFGDLKKLKGCFEETKRLFHRLVDLDIRNPSLMSGVGALSMRPTFRSGTTLYAGEAAGLQDLLYGFGIRSAFQSGALAAKCLLDGSDYEHAARPQFVNRLKAGLVNRYAWEKLGRLQGMDAFHVRGAELFLRHPGWIYNLRLWHRLAWPIANRYIRSKYGDRAY